MANNLYLICYDLNSPGQDYKDLIEQIKSYGTWWHHLDSTWIIKSSKTAKQIREHLSKYIDGNDELLVIQFGDEWAGKGFKQRAYDWLYNNAYKE
jgi:hypothetical protein